MLIIIPLFSIFTGILASNIDLCTDLFDGCQRNDYRYICSNLNVNSTILNTNHTFRNCSRKLNSNPVLLYFNLNKPVILDISFNIGLIEEIIQHTKYRFVYRLFTMRNIKGFDINYNLKALIRNYLEIQFFDSRFEFYSNGKLIRSCEDLTPDINPFFRNIMSNGTELNFKTVKFTIRTCPLIFNSNLISQINFNYLMDTFYKRNILEFYDLHNATDINSSISNVYFYNTEKVEFNSVLLNNLVFKNIEMLFIFGEVKFFEIGLFRSFKRLKLLVMDPFFLRPLFHRHGIDWLRDFNSDVYISDLENKSQIESLLRMNIAFFFNIDMNTNFISTYLDQDLFKRGVVFPSEDLCLYKEFPFDQLVIMSFTTPDQASNDYFKYTCTFVWIVQYYDLYSKYITHISYSVRMNLSEEIQKCEFSKKLELCSKKQFKKITSIFDTNEAMILFEFILIILTPVICSFGLVTNIIVIIVITQNKKELKETQYKFMSLNALSNSLILLIQAISLISECQRFNGIYCSQLTKYPVVQYFKIIFQEYITSFLFLFSNLTYMAFSISRLSLIGKNHSKLTVYVSNLTIGQFLIRVFLPCLALPVVKIFKYIPNFDKPEDEYPHPFVYFFNKYSKGKSYAFLSFNIFFDLINSFGFLVANLIVDILLAIRFKHVIEEKAKKTNNEEIKKSGQDLVNRVIAMVILNASIGVVLKAFLLYSPINDLINSIKLQKINPMEFYQIDTVFGTVPLCSYETVCHAIEKLGEVFYLISLSILLFFYKAFDKKFEAMLKSSLFKSYK